MTDNLTKLALHLEDRILQGDLGKQEMLVSLSIKRLMLKGQPVNSKTLARALGSDDRNIRRVLELLEEKGVISRAGGRVEFTLGGGSNIPAGEGKTYPQGRVESTPPNQPQEEVPPAVEVAPKTSKYKTNNPPTPQGGKEGSSTWKKTYRLEDAPEWFLSLWEMNPVKTALSRAINHARRIDAQETPETIAHICSAWPKYLKDFEAKNGKDTTYLKVFSNWLAEEMWHKYPAPSQPVPSAMASQPWAAVFAKHLIAPDGSTRMEANAVLNAANEIGAEPMQALGLYRRDGLEAAMNWAWSQRKEAS